MNWTWTISSVFQFIVVVSDCDLVFGFFSSFSVRIYRFALFSLFNVDGGKRKYFDYWWGTSFLYLWIFIFQITKYFVCVCECDAMQFHQKCEWPFAKKKPKKQILIQQKVSKAIIIITFSVQYSKKKNEFCNYKMIS